MRKAKYFKHVSPWRSLLNRLKVSGIGWKNNTGRKPRKGSFFLRGRRELEWVSTSWQVKNSNTGEMERRSAFPEIDNGLES